MQIPNADVGQGLPALLDTRSFTTAPVFAAFLRVDPNHLGNQLHQYGTYLNSPQEGIWCFPKMLHAELHQNPLCPCFTI